MQNSGNSKHAMKMPEHQYTFHTLNIETLISFVRTKPMGSVVIAFKGYLNNLGKTLKLHLKRTDGQTYVPN